MLRGEKNMRVELTGFTQYFNVVDNGGNEYTVVMMGDENSKSFDWEIYRLDKDKQETIGLDEEIRNRIIEAVISFEEKNRRGE